MHGQRHADVEVVRRRQKFDCPASGSRYLTGIMLRSSVFFVAALTALTHVGCDDPFADPGCTLVGCVNGARLTVARVGAWADGEYELDVQLGARQHSCNFTLPLSPAARPNEVSLAEQYLECTPALPAPSGSAIAAVFRVNPPAPVACPPGRDAGVEQGCDSDHYRLAIEIDASAADVALRLSVGDTVLLDERRALEYQTSYPNGPECGGPCRSASLTFNVEEP